jgi:hypothetical protein
MVEDMVERLDDPPAAREENDARCVDGSSIKIVVNPAEVIDSTLWSQDLRHCYITECLTVKNAEAFSCGSEDLLIRAIVRATGDGSRDEGVGQGKELRFTSEPQAIEQT